MLSALIGVLLGLSEPVAPEYKPPVQKALSVGQFDYLDPILPRAPEVSLASGEKETNINDYDLPPVLHKIAYCESGSRHWDENGDVVIGHMTPDIGLFQISPVHHLERTRELGIDVYTLQGNIEYALLLYEENGTRDWLASKPCWGKPVAGWN